MQNSTQWYLQSFAGFQNIDKKAVQRNQKKPFKKYELNS